MPKQVRRVVLGLAALTLLTSLFLAVQGFFNPPDQALAACEVQVSCGSLYYVGRPFVCCCSTEKYEECLCRMCTRVNLDCSVTRYRECPYCYCSGCCCECFP